MEGTKLTNTNILNNFFSRNTLRHCLDNIHDENYVSIIKRYIKGSEKQQNYKLINEIYDILKNNYRNEYLYKNTLINQLLIEKHDIENTSAFTEFPIAKSKADFLLINGKAVVYEIKTELDNLERLENQINDYFKAFNHVGIVTYENNIKSVYKILDKISKPVGIYILDSNCNLKEERRPDIYDNDISLDILYTILRKKEAQKIILKYYEKLPQVSDFYYYKECKKLFNKLPINEVYNDVLTLLKQRTNILKDNFINVPYELKFLSYFMNFKKQDYDKMNNFLLAVNGGV